MFATSLERSPAAHLSIPGWLDRLLLWIPRANRPGLLAFGLFLVRVTALPMVGAFIVLAPFSSALSAHPLLGISVMLAFSVLVEECGRYSFVRKAQRPGRAMALFTGLIIAVETATYWRPHASAWMNLTLRAPSMLVHVSAGLALLWALRRPSRLVSTLAAIYVLHLAFDIGSVALFGKALATSRMLGAPAGATIAR